MYDLGGSFGGRTVEAGTNLLLSGPPLSGKEALGYETLEHGAMAGEGSIVVTNTNSADRVRQIAPTLFEHDAPVGVVDCITKLQGYGTIADTELVQYASSPEDMTGIGIKSSQLIEQFSVDRGLTHNRVLFASVSTLLHYSTLQTVFRFLHVLTARIENTDAIGLFLVEAGVHDSETVTTISRLFDGMLQVDADGSVTARFR
ncbi:RAD55 family ATPase [Halorarius litoreus]|uniref:RAD55 family ATPase n=1 Tax=Halorarius litoreus TaxID=2962676 RepID=UPI0020CBDDF3|nr:recombinase RecA [Halorarius litoreus]